MARAADWRSDHVGTVNTTVTTFDWNGDQIRNDLRKTGLMALAGRLSTDDDVDMAIGSNLELSLLPWRADR